MHKEPYFLLESIEAKAQEFLDGVLGLRERHPNVSYRPQEAALLVLDMQEYFLDVGSHAYIPSAPAIVPALTRLQVAFQEAGRPVIFTRHMNTPVNAGMMAEWWRDLINPRSAHSQLIDQFNTSNTTIIKKNQYDAFYQTSLARTLRELGTRQVVICGVMTHLCCDTTARAAFMHGFEVFFTVDGTATYNEMLHRATLLTLSHGFCIPILVRELLTDMDSNAT
jgi:isochorismate hydrolase